MNKKTTINTVTAGAMARQIIKTLKDANPKKVKVQEDKIKADQNYKRLLKLHNENQSLEIALMKIKNELSKKYNADIYRDGSIRILSKKELSSNTLTDEIIIDHNVHGKSLEQITKELIAKYS